MKKLDLEFFCSVVFAMIKPQTWGKMLYMEEASFLLFFFFVSE